MSFPSFLLGVTGYYTRIDDTTLLAIRPVANQSAVLYFCDNAGNVLPFAGNVLPFAGNVLPFQMDQELKIDGVPVGAEHFAPDEHGFVNLQMSSRYCITWSINYITDIDYQLSEYFILPPTHEEIFSLYTMLVYGSANRDDVNIRVNGPMDRFNVGDIVYSELLGKDSTIINVDYDENIITVDNPVIYSGSNVTLFI